MNRQEFLKAFRKHLRRAIRIHGKVRTGYELHDRLMFRIWSMGCPFLFLGMRYRRRADMEFFSETGDYFAEWSCSRNLKKQMEAVIFSEGLVEHYKWRY